MNIEIEAESYLNTAIPLHKYLYEISKTFATKFSDEMSYTMIQKIKLLF